MSLTPHQRQLIAETAETIRAQEQRTGSLLVEGVAMTLFLCTLALWLVILEGRP